MYSRDELSQIHDEWNQDCLDHDVLDEDDGQPAEIQEWQDFDPDC